MTVSSPTPTFKIGLTPEEKKLYSQLFKSLDPESTGVITGEKARSTFEKSGLPQSILGEIWQIADQNNLGFLNQFGFCHALRLIGYAQAGHHPSLGLADLPGPLPQFADLSLPQQLAPLQPQSTDSSFMKSQPSSSIPQNVAQIQPNAQDSISTVSPADYQRFSSLFYKTVGSAQGELSGAKARDIFLKAKLPTSTLGQIWNLVDRDNSGKLNVGSFVIAMHLIQGILSGTIKQLPPFLPESIWRSVQSPESQTHTSVGSHQSSYSSIHSQPTTVARSSSLTAPQSDVPTNLAASQWTVTPTMKQQYESIFDQLDKAKSGHLNPDQVALFLMSSKLNQHDLAAIWDLADIQNTGVFTKLEFSIALFLVNKRLAGEKLPNVVPHSLLMSLQSDSSEQNPNSTTVADAQSQSNHQVSHQQTIQKPKTAMDDLVDIFGSSNPTSTNAPAPTAGSLDTKPPLQQRSSSSDFTPVNELPKVRNNLTGSFKPTSSFGQSLLNKQLSSPHEEKEKEERSGSHTPQGNQHASSFTPASSTSNEQKTINYDALRAVPPPPRKSVNVEKEIVPKDVSSQSFIEAQPSQAAQNPATSEGSHDSSYQRLPQYQQYQPPQNDDLLADSNPEISGQLSQATSDIANISNQIKSLTTQTTGLHEKKTRAEQELSRILSTKKEIENKLKQLRASYQNEVKQVEQVETNLATAKEEADALRSEASISEAKFNALSSELHQKQVSLEDLQKENNSLKEKLGYVNAEIVELEKQLEQVADENKRLSNQVSVKKSQVQVSIVKSEELKNKIQELEEANRKLQEELDKAGEEQRRLDQGHHALSQRAAEVVESKPIKPSDISKRVAAGAAVSAAVSSAGIVGYHLASDSNQVDVNGPTTVEEKSNGIREPYPSQNDSALALVDEVNDNLSADLTGIDNLDQIEPSSSFPDVNKEILLHDISKQEEDRINQRFPQLSINEPTADNVTNATAPSSLSTDYKNNDDETPVTTPSSSDFQFPQGANAGIVGGMVGMPGVLVGVQRTDSLTSSVQNNAALSVRDDNIDEISDRETLDNEAIGGSEETVPNSADTENFAVSDSVLNKSSSVHHEDLSDGDKISSGVESFELVNAEEVRGDEGQYSLQEERGLPSVASTQNNLIKNPPFESNAETSSVQNERHRIDDEFPPIRELNYNESSSSDDESQDEKFDDAVDSLPAQSAQTDKQQLASAVINNQAHPSNPADVKASALSFDDFDKAFDNLEPAKSEINQGENLFADEFDNLEAAKVDDTVEDFGDVNADFGFSSEFTNEPMNSNDTENNVPDFNRPSSQNDNSANDEWEQLFAGFGNNQTTQKISKEAIQNQATMSIPPPKVNSAQDAEVQELVGMGFDETTAIDALKKENWDLEAATNYLLDHA